VGDARVADFVVIQMAGHVQPASARLRPALEDMEVSPGLGLA